MSHSLLVYPLSENALVQEVVSLLLESPRQRRKAWFGAWCYVLLTVVSLALSMRGFVADSLFTGWVWLLSAHLYGLLAGHAWGNAAQLDVALKMLNQLVFGEDAQ